MAIGTGANNDSTPVNADAEFNPLGTRNPCSPFYLYNHDSPSTSTEQFSLKPPMQVSIRNFDLEKGGSTQSLTGTTTTPRLSAEKVQHQAAAETMRPWQKFGGKDRCMTKPKQKWLAGASKRQILALKLLVALLLVGAMVGVAVGIAVATHSGVWKGQNTQTSIGS